MEDWVGVGELVRGWRSGLGLGDCVGDGGIGLGLGGLEGWGWGWGWGFEDWKTKKGIRVQLMYAIFFI